MSIDNTANWSRCMQTKRKQLIVLYCTEYTNENKNENKNEWKIMQKMAYQ